MPEAWLFILFGLAAIVSLVASWLLVTRLERIGARLGLSEALLGMLAALAADGPEIASATTALIGGHAQIGAGVVIGSNVFNLAALLGLGALVAGRIALHRRVLALEGSVAVVIAGICVAVVVSGISAALGILACATVLIPYVAVSSGPANQRWLPVAWREWLTEAVTEEEIELEGTLDHARAGKTDIFIAIAALLWLSGRASRWSKPRRHLGSAIPCRRSWSVDWCWQPSRACPMQCRRSISLLVVAAPRP